MYDTILVTLMEMQLHYSQSSRENAIQSSDNSQLPPITRKYHPAPPGGGSVEFTGE